MGGDSPSTPAPAVGGSNPGPYTQSLINNMGSLASAQPHQIQLQQAYNKLFGASQPSYQSMANANALKMIDSLPLFQGKMGNNALLTPAVAPVSQTPQFQPNGYYTMQPTQYSINNTRNSQPVYQFQSYDPSKPQQGAR